MAGPRQQNWLGQQRVDVPHLRSLEAAGAGDLDLLAGRIIAGDAAYVVGGFALVPLAVSTPAIQLQVSTASGVLVHPLASDSGSIYRAPADRSLETLNASNTRVTGGFTANSTNYIGVDLRRSVDDSTADLVQFVDENTGDEIPKEVALARTLDYVIVVSTQDFGSMPGLCPLAIVVTDANNAILTIQDARGGLFRLGSGGSVPDTYHAYSWPYGRTEAGDNSDFQVGDKSIQSLKEWVDAAMTRMWELGGGEHWYSSTADRNVRMTRAGATFTNGEWFEWVGGANLHWKGLKFVFENSLAHYNDVANQTANSAGLTDLADGECVYVDLDRTTDRTGGTALVAVKAVLNTLGSPVVPGSRYILAWRVGSNVYTRDSSFPVGATFTVATNTNLGIVQLTVAAANPAIPLVCPVDGNGTLKNTATTNTFHGLEGNGLTTGSGVLGSAPGIGYGVLGTSTNGRGVGGTGLIAGGVFTGTTNGYGVVGNGAGTGAGVFGTGGATAGAPGVYGVGSAGGGPGLSGLGGLGGSGVLGVGGSTGTGNAGGVFTGGGSAGPGVIANGSPGNATDGIQANGVLTGRGGTFIGGLTGEGIRATGGATSGIAVNALSNGASPAGQFQGGPSAVYSLYVIAPSSAANAACIDLGGNGGPGNIFWAATNPTKTQAFQNALNQANVPKAWGTINVNNPPTYDGGFNITSIATADTNHAILVTMASPMADTNYAVILQYYNSTANVNQEFLRVGSKTTTTFKIYTQTTSGTDLTIWTGSGYSVDFVVFGLQ